MSSELRKWGTYAAIAGAIQGTGLELLKMTGKDKHKTTDTQTQNADGLIQLEPSISENAFEDKVEAAITNEKGEIDEKKVRKIDLGMTMIDFLISSGHITMEKGEALKKILETKRSQYRELAKTQNQLEVLHQIIQEHRQYDPGIAGLDDFLETGTGNCQGAATGILAITQGVYPDIETDFQNFTGAYGGHIRLIARIDGQWFSLERDTPTPITLEKGATTTPVTDLVKVMAGKNITTKENGTAEKPFSDKIDSSQNGSNPVVAKLMAHNNGAQPTATYGGDQKPTVLAPFKNTTLEEAHQAIAKENPYAADIAMRVAKDLQEKLKEKPETKAGKNPVDTHDRFKIRLVEKKPEQIIKDKILLGLHEIMLEMKSGEEKKFEIRQLFKRALKYGMIIDEMLADKQTKILQYPEVRGELEAVLAKETFQIWLPSSNEEHFYPDTAALLVRSPERTIWRQKDGKAAILHIEGKKISFLHINRGLSNYAKYPSGADLDKVIEILEKNTTDDLFLDIDTGDTERMRFAIELLVKMQNKIKQVILRVEPNSNLTPLQVAFKSITKAIQVVVIPDKQFESSNAPELKLPQENFYFAANTVHDDGIEVDARIVLEPFPVPSVRAKMIKPLYINEQIGHDQNDVNRLLEARILSILQGNKILINMSYGVSVDLLDKIMLDPRIRQRKPDFDIGDIFTCDQELLKKLTTYNINKLTIRSWTPGKKDLSGLRGGKFKLEFIYHGESPMLFDYSTYQLEIPGDK